MLVVLGQQVKEMLVVREVTELPIILAAAAAVPVVGVLLQVVLIR